jgi:hypothetical protein
LSSIVFGNLTGHTRLLELRQLGPRRLDPRFLGFNLCSGSFVGLQRVVEILLGDGLLLGEWLVFFYVEMSFALIGLRLRELPLRL